MTDNTVYTLVLVPSDEIAIQLVAFSEAVNERVDSELALGEHALPHITIVQWKDADLGLLNQQTYKLRDLTLGTLTLAGVSIVPGPDGDNWIEIPVLSTGAMRKLQEEALAATGGNGDVANGVGDRFRPHVTVGLTYSTSIELPALPPSLLRLSSDSWTPMLGLSGPNYTLTRLIEWE
ncbi:hypothetical protein [Nocardiopsis sp. FR4]|uniref:hypothetical protein n=1 Tax=Nocardiopsis sp. FR4 TaxID=2605985 RepID=UPI00135C3680|nr:hypothetical protein [Nocardiopsis sp. FR4]